MQDMCSVTKTNTRRKGYAGPIAVLPALTLLGIFGVLRPLMALGSAMRVVAHTLRKGDAEREAVLQPRRPNIFRKQSFFFCQLGVLAFGRNSLAEMGPRRIDTQKGPNNAFAPEGSPDDAPRYQLPPPPPNGEIERSDRWVPDLPPSRVLKGLCPRGGHHRAGF